MKAFRARGTFRAGNKDQDFSVDIVAKDKDDAIERVFSNFGSRHRASRRFVFIDEVKKIDASESSAPVVQAYFGISNIVKTDIPKSEEE
jgi:large subunit ribosomal protein LX